MSTNIQVPNYQQVQQVQQSQQPNHMGGNYNPHQQIVQPIAQPVHYDNYNHIVPVAPVDENTSKSVTFIADAISLDVMKDCDNIHINTLINMGIRLAKEHSFYKQFLINKENYNLKGASVENVENVVNNTHNTHNTTNANIVHNTTNTSNTSTAPVANVIPTTTIPATNNDLDFSKMFNN